MGRKLGILLLGAIGLGYGLWDRAKREQTRSTVNVEADRWSGGPTFHTAASDAYGHPLTSRIEKGILNFNLEVRSNGPDGLPKNLDDIVATRGKPHGESSLTDVTAKVTAGAVRGGISGIISGVKRSLQPDKPR